MLYDSSCRSSRSKSSAVSLRWSKGLRRREDTGGEAEDAKMKIDSVQERLDE